MLARALLLATAVALLLAPAAPAAQVEAGPLQARTTEDPWSLAFTDRGGGQVLAEAPGTAGGPTGRLGFRTALGWFRATRVVSARTAGQTRYDATLATNDPLGRRIELTLERDADGVIALSARVGGPLLADVTHTGIAFRARPGERYLALASYGDRAPVVSLRERRGRRVLLAFPRGRSSARLEDGGVLRSREGRGEWRLGIRSRRVRRWTIEASLATLRRPFRPCAVDASGGRLVRWRYARACSRRLR